MRPFAQRPDVVRAVSEDGLTAFTGVLNKGLNLSGSKELSEDAVMHIVGIEGLFFGHAQLPGQTGRCQGVSEDETAWI